MQLCESCVSYMNLYSINFIVPYIIMQISQEACLTDLDNLFHMHTNVALQYHV